MNLLIVRTIVVRRTILFLLIKLMGKQIGTEHAGVEGFHILLGSTFHQHTHVWQHAAELRITVSVRAYLFRAVRNRALNRLRDDRFSYIPFEELGEVFASPESLQIETDEITQLVAEAVSQLPGRCRDIFLKSRNEQLSNAEIAAEMHISVKTVEAQMSKALRRLRGLLHKE